MGKGTGNSKHVIGEKRLDGSFLHYLRSDSQEAGPEHAL